MIINILKMWRFCSDWNLNNLRFLFQQMQRRVKSFSNCPCTFRPFEKSTHFFYGDILLHIYRCNKFEVLNDVFIPNICLITSKTSRKLYWQCPAVYSELFVEFTIVYRKPIYQKWLSWTKRKNNISWYFFFIDERF